MQKITNKTPQKRILELGSICDKSGRCCQNGSGIVLEEELEALAKNIGVTVDKLKSDYLTEFTNLTTKAYRLKQKKKEGRPHGDCIFLKDKLCSIHSFKPLHCRVTSCCSEQGEELSLWFMEKHFLKDNEESKQEYDTYLKVGGKKLGDEHDVPETRSDSQVPAKHE